jgi:hypothetical protein
MALTDFECQHCTTVRYVWEHAISDTKSFHTAWSRYYKRRNLRRRNLLNPTWANNCLDVKYWLGLPVEILDLCERLRSKFYPLFRKLCVVRVNQSACLAFCANDKRNEPNDKMRMIKILPLDENFERTLYVLKFAVLVQCTQVNKMLVWCYSECISTGQAWKICLATVGFHDY